MVGGRGKHRKAWVGWECSRPAQSGVVCDKHNYAVWDRGGVQGVYYALEASAGMWQAWTE